MKHVEGCLMRKHHYVGDPKPICICDALRQADATGYGRAVTEFLEKGYVYKSEHEQAIKEAEERARDNESHDIYQTNIVFTQEQWDAEYARIQRDALAGRQYLVAEAHQQGYDEGYEAGYDAALRSGAASPPKTWPQIQADFVIRQAEAITYFNQHGQGENP